VSKYLDFILISDSGKTQRFAVRSRSHGDSLAYIRWYSPWRQYTVNPVPGTVWNKDCLRDVAGFLDGLMRERRQAAREAAEATA